MRFCRGPFSVLEFEGGFVTYVDGDAVGRAGRPPGGFLQGLDGLFPADVVVGAEDLDVAQFALLVDREGDPHVPEAARWYSPLL